MQRSKKRSKITAHIDDKANVDGVAAHLIHKPVLASQRIPEVQTAEI